MNEHPATVGKAEPEIVATGDVFGWLACLGWPERLAAIIAGLAISFLLFGYALVYWRNADMDFMVIYSALAMNVGKPQQFLDHTAYLSILSVKSWFQLLHGLGLLDAYTLPAIPPASDASAFDAAMTQAVRAGRVLAFLIAALCVLIFAGLARRIFRDWHIAFFATLAFALSGGIAEHSRLLRSELIAACPVIFALMILIVIGRRASLARPLGMAAAAALCVIGLENKVQVILLIGTLPFVILPFGGPQSASVAFWRNTPAGWLAAAIAAIIALAAAWTAWPLIATGLDRGLLDAAEFRPLLLNRFGVYQITLLVLIGGTMIAYAAIWRVSAAEMLAAIAAVVAGASLALLLLDADYNAGNVIAVINPLEKMLVFADANTSDAANGSSLKAVALLLDGLASVLARYSFVLHSSSRPTVFLTWLIIPGIVAAWRRGEKQAALQALALMLAATGIDTLGVRRGLKIEYFIFTDPLIVLAGAMLLEAMPDMRLHKWASSIAVTLFGLHVVVGQAEPLRDAFRRVGPESICAWNPHYMPLMPLPWCPRRP
jgi:hypothetical protein